MAAESTARFPEKSSGGLRRERFVRRRKALGLTQEDLAALLKIDRSTVLRWERGETEPQPWLRPRLAKALRMSADQLTKLLATTAAPENGGTSVVPRQLPPAVADFTGRAAELEVLSGSLDAAGTAPGTVVIYAIGGTAGVGKTALAVYWAHRVAERFADGQLHVNLRGFDPSGPPLAPEEAIRGFLDALGVPPERVPPDAEAQAGLYRSLLAGRKLLIVLDNARDEQQVRPLLPASPGSLVLVTSRNQLTGLAAADGARLLSLDVFAPAEAVRLLTARIGASRTAAEPEAVAEIAALCACLPLALAVIAARAAAAPLQPLTALAAELRDTAGRLDVLDEGDPAASVRAVFSWSYDQLSPAAARLFRLLGLHPGPDISVPAAASLAAADEAETRRLLRELSRAHLLTEQVSGRYSFHDLLRSYAGAQARATDSEPERTAAIARVLDHYLHTASHGAQLLSPFSEAVPLAPPRPGVTPEQLADRRQAQDWFDAEQQVLLTAADLAAESAFEDHAWQLAWAISPFVEARGLYGQAVAMHRRALAAARRLGDLTGQAVAGRLLAGALFLLRDYDQALAHIANSLTLYRRLGNQAGEAVTFESLGVITGNQGRYSTAIGHHQQAIALFRAVGDMAGEAHALNNLGWCYAHIGDYQQARATCRQALALTLKSGHRYNEPSILDSIGYAEHRLGDFAEAAACYIRALSVCREFGDPLDEAIILTHLGDTRLAAGEPSRARDAWQAALAILEDLDHPDADGVRAKLADLQPHEQLPGT